MKSIITILLFAVSIIASANELTLTKDKIGNLELSDKTMISLEKMKSLFPMYKVSHAIGQGDSPDFHYITVSTTEGEELFSTYSYFSDDVNKNTKEYKIDLLVTNSKLVVDSHGIKVGDKTDKVFTALAKDISLTANHHDNSIGKDKIYYQFVMPENVKIENISMTYLDPVAITLDQVKKENPTIRAISWPTASWD